MADATRYAEVADLDAYIEDLEIGDADALNRLLGRASRDVDRLFASIAPGEAGGLRWGDVSVNTRGLTGAQIEALNRATCAQAEYRLTMGEAFFVRDQYKSASGPDFSTTGALARIGPKVMQELSGSGLLVTGARAVG